MSRAATTYWDNNISISTPRRATRLRSRSKAKRGATPQWFIFVIAAMISFMLCLTINLRAFVEMRQERNLNHQLSLEVDQISAENSAMLSELTNLKKDPATIERESRKLGWARIQ